MPNQQPPKVPLIRAPSRRPHLTSTTMVHGAQPDDVRVTEVHWSESSDVLVQVARGPVAIQFYGTLSELQLLVVAVTDGLVKIGEARGLENR